MRVGGHDHDFHAAPVRDGAQLLRHVPAGDIRQRQIDHRQIRLALFRQLHAGLAVARDEHRESERAQQVLQQLQMQRIIVGTAGSLAAGRGSRSCGCGGRDNGL